ncbi:MAG: hypothetical protein IJE08_03880 [Clostridia bacterium]|nr:hypothetical protein [Clostridia bacterium]
MNSEEMNRREERARRICRGMAFGYAAAGAGLAVFYAVRGNWYLAAQSVGTILVLAMMYWAMRLLHIKPVWQLCSVIVGFTFAAYTLGVACAFYKILPGYDKLLHMLSGTLSMMLALPLFYAVKAGHRIEKSDCALAAAFCVAASVAAAGIWEIAEYALSIIAGIDPQCVAATGVADTMKDMIVCTIGALAGVPPLIRFYRTGRGGFLYGPAQAFIEINLPAECAAENHQGDGEERELSAR